MPLRITRRPSTGSLTIVGTVSGQRIRRRAQSDDPRLAREEAAALEAEILRSAWHGERRGARSFAEAVISYLEASPRSENHKARLHRLLRAIGDVPLGEVDQQKAIELKQHMLRPEAAPGTYTRAIVMPIRAVMHYAHRLGWCDVPHIIAPRENQGRTLFLLPEEVDRLVNVAAPHLRPLLIFLVGTGARMAEAIELEWRDVDLRGGLAIFWRTKGRKRRNALLSPRVVAEFANLRHREGAVFLTSQGLPYADRERRYGGQIKKWWARAIARADLNPALNPHDLRHTWASWHYALHRDLLRLQQEGGWSSVTLVARYAHLMPAGQEAAIRRLLWYDSGTDATSNGTTH